MHDTLTTPLPGSWLSSRLGVNPREIEQLRDRGELFALRDDGEWLYPAWQFGPGGSIPTGVREAVKAARAAGLDEARPKAGTSPARRRLCRRRLQAGAARGSAPASRRSARCDPAARPALRGPLRLRGRGVRTAAT